ncbi:DUF4382 domain-containing protein [Shewanella submarina]|uniref:DUF4382 domain-containing protein n=1 Tax=Shewanella submarina TaxID=2016376 RepID=A0ABV7G8P1_9GAMM|nr:DUF4382 domain-containing protein [Shewanella submarina]MCL1038316.1 DUF4382 domain-containing protein [Shewanella submarina]
MKAYLSIIALTVSGALLTGCGGSSDDSPAPNMGRFSLGVSDNPASVQEVNIAFKQVVLKGASETHSFNVDNNGDAVQVNLLDYQGDDVRTLVTGKDLPFGEYQLCIYMENREQTDVASSYVKDAAGSDFGLVTNSNGSCGGTGADDADTGRLFFNKKFTIAAGDNNFVAEFDLAKVLQAPHGNKNYYTLKPTAVQLVNTVEVGSVEGDVSTAFMAECEADAGGSEFSPVVYLYPQDTLLENMGDFNTGASVLTEVAPLASARVVEDSDTPNTFEYEFGFVAAGTYTLGYTCLAQNDDPDADNNADDVDAPFKMFAASGNLTVTAGSDTVQNFPVN